MTTVSPSEMASPAPHGGRSTDRYVGYVGYTRARWRDRRHRWCLRPAVGSRYTERDGKAGAVDGVAVAARARLRALGPKGGPRRHGYQPAG